VFPPFLLDLIEKELNYTKREEKEDGTKGEWGKWK